MKKKREGKKPVEDVSNHNGSFPLVRKRIERMRLIRGNEEDKEIGLKWMLCLGSVVRNRSEAFVNRLKGHAHRE